MIDYSKVLSKSAVELKPSGIRKFFDLLGDRKDVLSLTIGEPDFQTPWHIREAAIRSLEKGKTHYTSNSGLSELREAISAYLSRRFDLSYNAKSEITVTVGGSEAIDMAIRALVNPGDEVIIPQPAFVCYDPLVKMAGGTPVIVETKEENSFKLTADELKAAISDKTKLLVLPYPNNPTGAIMTKEDLAPIADFITSYCFRPASPSQEATSSQIVSDGLKPSDFFAENAIFLTVLFVAGIDRSDCLCLASSESSLIRRPLASVSFTVSRSSCHSGSSVIICQISL